jgi:hypothetical protein
MFEYIFSPFIKFMKIGPFYVKVWGVSVPWTLYDRLVPQFLRSRTHEVDIDRTLKNMPDK